MLNLNRHHKPRQVLRFIYPNLWNNWGKQSHKKGEERQLVGLWAKWHYQWVAHHCEYSAFVIQSTVLGQRTWSCYGWHASMLQNTIAILNTCWVIHSITFYCIFHMPSGMYIVKELLWQFVLIVTYISSTHKCIYSHPDINNI